MPALWHNELLGGGDDDGLLDDGDQLPVEDAVDWRLARLRLDGDDGLLGDDGLPVEDAAGDGLLGGYDDGLLGDDGGLLGDEDGLLGDEDLLGEEEEEWVGEGEEGAPGFRAALFNAQADKYAKFRPAYPEHVYQRIFEFAGAALGRAPGSNTSELALDIGCGPGRVALELARTYANVIGVDPSKNQLAHALQARNVRYLQTAAELLSDHLPRASVDLIAMAETLHWVNHLQFYEQARRVLKPTGVVAIWCYDLQDFVPMGPHQPEDRVAQANAHMRAFTYGVLGPFWDYRRAYIDNRYSGLEPKPTQFRVCLREENMTMDHVLSMNHFIGYLSSWSPYAAYRSTHPDKEDPLIELKAQFKDLLNVIDDDAPSLLLRWPIFFLLIRDPVQ